MEKILKIEYVFANIESDVRQDQVLISGKDIVIECRGYNVIRDTIEKILAIPITLHEGVSITVIIIKISKNYRTCPCNFKF